MPVGLHLCKTARQRGRQTDRHQKVWERESGFSNRVPALPALLSAEKTDKSSLHREREVLCSFQWTLDVWICEVKHIDNNVILLHEHVGIDSKDRLILCAWERQSYKWINGFSNKECCQIFKIGGGTSLRISYRAQKWSTYISPIHFLYRDFKTFNQSRILSHEPNYSALRFEVYEKLANIFCEGISTSPMKHCECVIKSKRNIQSIKTI